jgi:hypothetical protein
MKRLAFGLFILFFCASLFAGEYTDGRIRLVLHPQTGRFSLYYLVDPSRQNYEAMFMDQDPRTSVVTLHCNGKAYRLGESPEFKISEGGTPQAPALVFESSFAAVTMEFNFIATGSSRTTNGIWIGFSIENRTRRRMQAGLRLLLDTKLGESSVTPFSTDIRSVEEEVILDASTRDRYWVSGPPGEFSLMGSISASVNRIPDRIHIANWKRLNDVPWTLEFVQGRKFNYPPYSIRDSALAYYYEPVRIDQGGSNSFSLLLSSWDAQDFKSLSSLKVPRNLPGRESGGGEEFGGAEEPENWAPPLNSSLNPAIIRSDYHALLDIIDRIDGYLDSGVPMSDDEITSIEQDLGRIRSRYADP